jgi:sugar transferase (PEP-CTERM/EpsH1 system associated)
MRVLWIKSDVLLPLDTGGKLRTWHLLRNLATRHDVTYLGGAAGDQRPEHIDGMREVARHVHVVPRSNAAKGSLRFYADAALHLLDPLPYAVGKYRSRAFRSRVEDLLRTGQFDLIVCDFLVPAVNLPRQLPCPSVLFTHNVEAEIWRRHAETRRGRLGRFLYETQHRRMLRFEARTLARFDGVLAVSDADRDTFARLYPGAIKAPVQVIPTGVDTAFFTPAPSSPGSRSLVFTGSMDWLPNEDAMLFFCREVLPIIRREEPDVTLSIVGRTPTAAVARLAQHAGIVVTGRVDDVRPHISNAAVYIVPLRIGGGTRLKIFEALSMGKAVVSTTIGAEGLPVTDGAHLMLADTAQTFAETVVRLLRNLEQRRSLEAAARALVVEHYDWAAAADELDRALTKFARRGVERDGTAAAEGADVGAVRANEPHAAH